MEEANGMDSGTMERTMELQDVFMLKTSLLSRLRMQREDAAHAQVMAKCQAILARTKELGGVMEQVRCCAPCSSLLTASRTHCGTGCGHGHSKQQQGPQPPHCAGCSQRD